ncbi:hypothetical protein TNIN_348791 [Trichonephila inaurata madagascariensis]|uniref:Uncharacterized protein n=1 Tax=Trichonephila inaurata madagascariensis TaxID=2747483 RepID=A0A8X7C6T7_9ARAC|nr:hypothetical protein TNIN_348791 [Trichonephila inaurata madagascariensis]
MKFSTLEGRIIFRRHPDSSLQNMGSKQKNRMEWTLENVHQRHERKKYWKCLYRRWTMRLSKECCCTYTATMPNLLWDSGCNLYAAADKYEILSLKSECSFLKDNLSSDNALDLLILSDLHQDEDL